MNEIPYEELKQYVKMIYDLETSLFQQETLIKKLKKDCSSQVPDAPEAPQLPGKLSERKKTSLTFWGMLVLAIALIVLPFILKVGIGWKLLIGFFSITFAIIILFPAFGVVGPDIGTSKTEAEETAEYNSNLKKYNKELDAYHRRVYQLEQVRQSLSPLQKKQAETRQLLYDAYNVGTIHPKYRNFVAISSIYEYLDTGRCVALTGYEGAYNCYENDCKANLIISLLTEILANLRQIKENQFMLYQAIERSNELTKQVYQGIQELRFDREKIEQLGMKLENLERNTAAANYIAELTRKELEYRNYLSHGSTYRRP